MFGQEGTMLQQIALEHGGKPALISANFLLVDFDSFDDSARFERALKCHLNGHLRYQRIGTQIKVEHYFVLHPHYDEELQNEEEGTAEEASLETHEAA